MPAPPDSRPALKRTDSQPLNETEEPKAFQRLIVSVDSVHYYEDLKKHPGRRLSAVLLNVCFNLRGDFLKIANPPLIARSTESGAELDIEILENYPSTDERVLVMRVDRRKRMVATPSLSANIASVGLGVSDMGIEKESRFQEDLTILLSPQLRKHDPYPTQLSWVFQGLERTIYPSNIRLLVIVHEPYGDELDFPFHLYIQKTGLSVITQGWNIGFLTPLCKKRDSKHQGWYFGIRAVFKPEEAQKALKNTVPVGLEAAWRKTLPKSQTGDVLSPNTHMHRSDTFNANPLSYDVQPIAERANEFRRVFG